MGTILCPELLYRTQQDYKNGLELSAFVPDFTARVIENSRILRISRENFLKCLTGKLRNYSRPFKETRQKIREIKQRQAKSESFTPGTFDSSNSAYTVAKLATLNSGAHLSTIASASGIKSSYSLAGGNNVSRTRFYDETYIGHEHEGRENNKAELPPPNASGLDLKGAKATHSGSDIELGSR